MLVNNACCDGNLLLSWGPHSDGAFDTAKKRRLLEVGAWLKDHGRAIYGTARRAVEVGRVGRLIRPRQNGLAARRKQEGDTLRFTRPAGTTVVSAAIVDRRESRVQTGRRHPGRHRAQGQPSGAGHHRATHVRQSRGRPAGIGGGEVSLFHDTVTYGRIVSRHAKVKTSSTSKYDPPAGPQALVAEKPAADFAFSTSEEMNPWVELDLGRDVSVTGVRVRNRVGAGQAGQDRAATLRLSVSLDGKTWQQIWKADRGAAQWEIPVTDFLAARKSPAAKPATSASKPNPARPNTSTSARSKIWGKE